ncbi:MAG TPA: VOC family protein, partial [Mycobacterium sp.]|nr:VOC family protein [Mycobacterium sp.]
VHHDDGTLAAQRMVSSLAWLRDSFGFRHELIHGLATEPGSFSAGRPGVQFVTGDEGLGHAVLIVPDWDAATHLFIDVLGFHVSDDIEAGIKVRFLHCNPRHHSLAFSALPGMAGFHHLMLEVTDPQHVRQAYQLVQERGLPVAMTLGKHTNDEMFSFYVRTPSGFEIEYGAGGRVIDLSQPWPVGHYDAMSSWGHQPPTPPLFPGILHAAASPAS